MFSSPILANNTLCFFFRIMGHNVAKLQIYSPVTKLSLLVLQNSLLFIFCKYSTFNLCLIFSIVFQWMYLSVQHYNVQDSNPLDKQPLLQFHYEEGHQRKERLHGNLTICFEYCYRVLATIKETKPQLWVAAAFTDLIQLFLREYRKLLFPLRNHSWNSRAAVGSAQPLRVPIFPSSAISVTLWGDRRMIKRASRQLPSRPP